MFELTGVADGLARQRGRQHTIAASVANCKADLHNTLMILGTGVDIAEVPRIRGSIERFGDRFLRRIFTTGEIEYCDGKASRFESYAARFARKEAGMKALGTGWSRGVRWRDIEVVRQKGQRPTIQFSRRSGRDRGQTRH